MAIRVVIETASRAEAELIAQKLPVKANADSWRGFGVIRVAARNKNESNALIDAVSQGFQEHKLQWARVRYDDEERIFRANAQQRNRRRAG